MDLKCPLIIFFNTANCKNSLKMQKKELFVHFFAKKFGSLFFFFCFALELCSDTIKQVFLVKNYLYFFAMSLSLQLNHVPALQQEIMRKFKYRLRSQILGRHQHEKCPSNQKKIKNIFLEICHSHVHRGWNPTEMVNINKLNNQTIVIIKNVYEKNN